MIRKDELTAIFPGPVKPIHVGVYLRYYSNGVCMYSFWDGKRWCLSASSVDEAFKDFCKSRISGYQGVPWQGILKQG